MTATNTAGARVFYDLGEWAAWVGTKPPPGKTHLWFDRAVEGSGLVDAVEALLTSAGLAPTRSATVPGASWSALKVDDRLQPGDQVVAVGGGGVIDRAKLLGLTAGQPAMSRRLVTRQRCGFVALPAGIRREVTLSLVPTTVGTGAEVSRTACLEHAGVKRLIFGEALRAEAAVLSPRATEGLPVYLVLEGVVEVLLRLAGAYVGSLRDVVEPDRLVERHVQALVACAEEVAQAGPSTRVDAGLRETASRLSAHSHSDDVIGERDPYCDVAWPLANELSMATGCRKLTALAVVTPGLWARVAAGDTRLGAAERLHRLWSVLRRATSNDPGPEPSAGLHQLLKSWGLDLGLNQHTATATELAHRAGHAWGLGLPMLKGLAIDEIAAIYADAFDVAGGSARSAAIPVADRAQSEMEPWSCTR